MSTITTSRISPAASTSPGLQVPGDCRPIFTIDELIKRRAVELRDSPLIGYPKQGVADFEEHSAQAVDRYVDAAVQKLQLLGLAPVDCSLDKPPVIGILAQSGLHVLITIMALIRLGYTVFMVSTRLASPALTQLLKLANCRSLLTTSNFHQVLTEVRKERDVEVMPLLTHSDYYGKQAPPFTRSYSPEAESRKVAVIIHSSGSTGLPKPTYLTHSSCLATYATNMNMRALIASPLFHSHGFVETFRSIHSGKPIYLCNYTIPLTRKSLMEMIDVAKPEIFHCIPYMIKLLAETKEGILSLAKLKLVLFAGSACPDDMGQKLTDNGVYLVANYGATETGRLMTSARPPDDKDWNYLRVLPAAEAYVLMDKIAPDLYECVALEGLKSKSTTNSDNPPGSFRTRDLFTRHPTRPNLWRFACRLDDRFTLINGEKVLPIPIEGRIRQEEMVKEACVFGEGRSMPGVLVIKADSVANIPTEEFIERLWPAIEDANTRTETFSRIAKELVVVLPADVQYPRTDKGTFIRVPMYRYFEKDINAAYDVFDHGNGGNISVSGHELEEFLLQTLKEKVGVDLESPSADFFAAGVDSLQCLQMWNFIKRELDLGGRQEELSQNVLYETGNVRELSLHLMALRGGWKTEKQNELEKMKELIVKYSSFEPHTGRKGATAEGKGETVVLTGATGGLGAHLLAQLASRPEVSVVWTLIRATNDESASERIDKALIARGLYLNENERSKVVALACDLSKPGLGLDETKLFKLRNSLTCVIHSAWAVNFNISVQSFEDQHIKATQTLIQLSLSVHTARPARFFFCSSVSASGGSPRPGTVDEGPIPTPAYAQGTGYARSKYVAEHITLNAAKTVGAPARVLRVGQLVGDSKLGLWNSTEGIPLMIQTAVTLGALPALDEEMTWLPVDYAAAVILELSGINRAVTADITDGTHLVYHVLNPIRFHWARDMLPALANSGLEFDILPTDEWMAKLRSSDRDPTRNPPIKLLDWFESKYGSKKGSEKTETLVYVTDKTIRASPTLASLPDVTNSEFVQKMVGALQKSWNGVIDAV